ncbi:hypothetical protein [Niveibacterium umoris]|uniref:Uncharacterized protein n=1 Tax=Niveibacterium umoris TaxID=1193620 RepID=A0A840BJC5_9RHOO|nr:hypothetical protein [Niveibacterium umoris]MBB4013641.1 hypothetical protein [Niveibacterium umoris]
MLMDAENPLWPQWLAQGKLIAAIIDDAPGSAATVAETQQSILDKTGLDARTARRFERLYRFLASEYPEALNGKPLAAGSVAVAELAKLHDCSPSAARELATEVFTGTLPADGIRARLDEALAQSTASVRHRRLSTSRRVAEFERDAVERIRRNPELLGLGPVDELQVTPSGRPLMPDMVLLQQGLRIAVEVKAAGQQAPMHVVGGYLARLAQLLQRYDRAVLVLPSDCVELANLAHALQDEWAPSPIHVVCL